MRVWICVVRPQKHQVAAILDSKWRLQKTIHFKYFWSYVCCRSNFSVLICKLEAKELNYSLLHSFGASILDYKMASSENLLNYILFSHPYYA